MLSDARGNPNGTTPSTSDKPVEIQLTGPLPSGLNLVYNEIPPEVPDGIVTAFTLLNAPTINADNPNGMLDPRVNIGCVPPAGWTLAGVTVTFGAAYIPQAGDVVYFNYSY